MKKSLHRGFTLIELLVVIAIIGILASVVLISLNGARGKARDVRVEGDIKNMRDTLESDFTGASYPDLSNAGILGGFAVAAPGTTTLNTLIGDISTQGGGVNIVVSPGTDPVTAYAIYGRLVSSTTVYDCMDSKGGNNQVATANNTATCP